MTRLRSPFKISLTALQTGSMQHCREGGRFWSTVGKELAGNNLVEEDCWIISIIYFLQYTLQLSTSHIAQLKKYKFALQILHHGPGLPGEVPEDGSEGCSEDGEGEERYQA